MNHPQPISSNRNYTLIFVFLEKIMRSIIKCISFQYFTTFDTRFVVLTVFAHYILNFSLFVVLGCQNKEKRGRNFCHHYILYFLIFSHVNDGTRYHLFHPFLQFILLVLSFILFFDTILLIKYPIL